ncbi:MAG: SelB C-terminal domain-containing protein, partial [Anaerolineales bacterium]|nr:SelB C-terminal domain-containing protein [Anaerolineales bacterium]
PVSQDVIFRKKDYEEMVERIKTAIQQKGRITLAEVRDMLDTTRKYIQALLEHMDAIGITMRDGDARKLKN